MSAVAKINQNPIITAEQVLIRGDLTNLSDDERVKYYANVCKSVGLNPLTKPFEYIVLNGKTRLYALKDCTDQLRSIHHVSVTDMTETEREGVFIVTVKVMDRSGRTDIAKGAVNIANLRGEALANALMKAETKAKRRATLSICGLGMLDETEVDDIPDSAKQQPAFKVPSPPKQVEHVVETPKDDPARPVELTPFKDEGMGAWAERFIASVETSKTPAVMREWQDLNSDLLHKIQNKAKKVHAAITKALDKRWQEIKPQELKEDPISTGLPPKKIAGPDIIADYEGWISWASDQIRDAEDGGWLENFANETIAAAEGALFPPDYEDLMSAVTKKLNALNDTGE